MVTNKEEFVIDFLIYLRIIIGEFVRDDKIHKVDYHLNDNDVMDYVIIEFYGKDNNKIRIRITDISE